MALTLGLVEGRGAYIGDTLMTIERIIDPLQFEVRIHGKSMDIVVTITDKQAAEVVPNVMVSAGLDGTYDLARAVFNAPRHVKIWRDSIYREKKLEQKLEG